MQRPVALALQLHRHGASFVVVGSAAAALRGEPARPADLDVVVHPDDAGDFVSAVRALGGDLGLPQLRRCRDVHVDTAWGPLDVFLAAYPVDVPVRVGERALRVAT